MKQCIVLATPHFSHVQLMENNIIQQNWKEDSLEALEGIGKCQARATIAWAKPHVLSIR